MVGLSKVGLDGIWNSFGEIPPNLGQNNKQQNLGCPCRKRNHFMASHFFLSAGAESHLLACELLN
jgi:hypothetical protein